MTSLAEETKGLSRVIRNAGFATTRKSEDESDRLWIIALGTLVVVQLWLGMITTSFWLDETGTWWIVKDGVAEALQRSLYWTGPSAFYPVAALFGKMFGLSEVSLRLPSVFAMAGAIWFLYLIGKQLYGGKAAISACFLFVCAASYYAVDARPYGLAMFFVTVSIWGFLRWLESDRMIYAAIYVFAGALVVYTHCLMSLALGAPLVFGIAATWKTRRLIWLAVFQLAIAVSCLPLLPKLKVFYDTRTAHTIAKAPTSGALLEAFVPCSLAGALVLLVWLWARLRDSSRITGVCTKTSALLIGWWAILPPLVLFALPVVSDLHLFVDRYYSSALPGQALLVGGLLSSIRIDRVRIALLVTIAAGSVLAQGRAGAGSHGREDWRAAMSTVLSEAGSAPVLVNSAYAEAVDFNIVTNSRLSEVLFSPQLMYGRPKNLIPLPHVFAEHEPAALEQVAEQLKGVDRFYLLSDRDDGGYKGWFRGRFASRCRVEQIKDWFDRFTCNN